MTFYQIISTFYLINTFLTSFSLNFKKCQNYVFHKELGKLIIENALYPINQQHSLLRNPTTQNNTVNNVTS